MPQRQKRKKHSKVNYHLKQKAPVKSSSLPKVVTQRSNPTSHRVSESSSSGSLAPLSSSPEPRVAESATPSEDPQRSFRRFINNYMIYFRAVRKKVNECLSSSALKPSQKSLTDLNCLKDDLRSFLDKVEQFYYNEYVLISEIEHNPQFNEILKCTASLQAILNQLDDSEIPGLLQTTIATSDEHTLCSILGLRAELAEFLQSRDPEVRGHQTDEQWILDFIESKNKELFKLGDRDEEFEFLGFTEVKAHALQTLVEKNPFVNQQTTADWAGDHIEQEFKYNILLAGRTGGWATEEYNTSGNYDEEFHVPTDDCQGVTVKAWDTSMLPKDQLHQTPWLRDYIDQQQDSLTAAKFWFHGTDHDSALAIIIFKADPAIFQEEDGITLEGDSPEWANLVKFFRKSKKGCEWIQAKKYRRSK